MGETLVLAPTASGPFSFWGFPEYTLGNLSCLWHVLPAGVPLSLRSGQDPVARPAMHSEGLGTVTWWEPQPGDLSGGQVTAIENLGLSPLLLVTSGNLQPFFGFRDHYK